MLKVDQIISQYEEALDVTSSEADFSYEYYIDLTNQQRALHIRNEHNKKSRAFDDTIVQLIPCLEMEPVSRVLCAGIEISGCLILRSKQKLPDTVELHGRDTIISVGSPDLLTKRISHVNYSTIPDRGNSKVTRNDYYSFLLDGYLYLYSKNPNAISTKYLMVRLILEDPLSLEDFLDISGEPCFDRLQDNYPISTWMWESLVKPQVVQLLLREYMIKKDLDNDSKEEEDNVPQTRRQQRQTER